MIINIEDKINFFSENKNIKKKLFLKNKLFIYDSWTIQISKLEIKGLTKQIALNSWKEEISSNKIYLHLRPWRYYLYSYISKKKLCLALSKYFNKKINLFIIEDKNLLIKTPIELYQEIFKKKMTIIEKKIENDLYFKNIIKIFNAKLHKESIKLI